MAAPAFAQEADAPAARQGALDEIVVSAAKRGDQSAQDVPIAIQAIGGDALAQSGAVQFSDYAYRVPSLTFQDLGPGDKKYIIRGVNSTGAATVGAYYDEAVISADNRNDGGGRNADIRLYDIERIEVLKGPQGTLYGASSESGTIRIITNKPNTDGVSGYLSGSVSNTEEGDFNYAVNGAVNLPIIEDKLALRVVGWKIDDSGFVDQTRVPSGFLENVNNDQTSGGRATLRYTPTDFFTLTASATIQDTHSDGSSRYTPAGTLSFEDQVTPPTLPSFPAVPGGDLINTDLTRSPLDDEIEIYSLTGEYEFAGGVITATSNYFDRDMRFTFDSSPILFFFGVPIPGITIQPQSREIWSNELRYASKFDGPFNFVAGGFYSHEASDFDVEVVRSNNLGEPRGPFTRLNSDDALSNPDGNTFFGRFDNNKLKQYAFFGEATFDFTPTISATGGIRYFHNSLNATQETTHPFGGFGPNPPGVLTNNSTDDKVTYKGNLTWKPNDDSLFYFTAAQGFRTGGLNQADLPFASGIPRSYDSDSLWNYEAGTKLTLADGRVLLDAAAYHIDWSNIQVRAVDSTGAFPFTTNAGSASVNGGEAVLTALLTEGVTLEIGGSYQIAKLTSDQPGPTPRPPELGLDGDRLPNVPKFTGSVNLDIERPLTPTLNYLVHADVNYHGASHTTLGRTRDQFDVALDDYFLASLRLGVANDDWTAVAFVRNITDERAQVDAISSSQDPLALITIRPRTYGIELTRRF